MTISRVPTDAHATIVAVAIASAEKHPELGQHGDGAGDRRRNRHQQRVVIFDVRKFVRDDSRKFIARKHAEQPGCDCDGTMLRIAPGGEGIRLRIVHHKDARHRKLSALGEFGHHVNEFGGGVLVDFLGALRRQHKLVGIPVRYEIRRRGDKEGDHRTARSADQIADQHEQGGQTSEQNCGAQVAHRHPRSVQHLAAALYGKPQTQFKQAAK